MKINANSALYDGSVFLGGTCGTSTWRKELIPLLRDEVPYFDPQLGPGEWNDEAAKAEDACKTQANLNVFVITGDSLGTYSGWEICEEAHRAPEKLVFCTVGQLPENQVKGLEKIKKQLLKLGATVCNSLEEIADVVNAAY